MSLRHPPTQPDDLRYRNNRCRCSLDEVSIGGIAGAPDPRRPLPIMSSSAFGQASSWTWDGVGSRDGPRARHSQAQPAESASQQQNPRDHPKESENQAFGSQQRRSEGFPQEAGDRPSASSNPGQSSTRRYPPRTCRICLEVVNPTYQEPSPNIPGILNPTPTVAYISSDPQAGRLIRPCKCKGSSRFVHEGCLQQWRHADPAYGKRNYWQCPTCGFKYRLERMKWANWISSKGEFNLM